MRKFYSILNQLQCGDRIVVPKSAWEVIQHHAIYLGYENGNHYIIENKNGIGVRVVTSEVFFENVSDITRTEKFYPTSNYSRNDLMQYALNKRGTEYDLWNYNCEHFANDVRTGRVSSKQVNNAYAGMGLVAALLFFGFLSGGDEK